MKVLRYGLLGIGYYFICQLLSGIFTGVLTALLFLKGLSFATAFAISFAAGMPVNAGLLATSYLKLRNKVHNDTTPRADE